VSQAGFALLAIAIATASCGSKGSGDSKASADKSSKAAPSSSTKSASSSDKDGDTKVAAKPRVDHKMNAGDVCLNGPRPKGANASKLVTADEYMWPNGSTIKVGFIDGSAEQIKVVIDEASEWMKYANIKFEWYPDPDNRPNDLDELVTFKTCDPGEGPAWYVRGAGPQSSHFGKRGEFSICLSAFEPEWAEVPEHARASVKHEFGHVLGLMHEQFNPDLTGRVHWDRDYVHDWCKQTQNWDERQCDAQVMATLKDISPNNHWKASKFDPDSIMFYGIKDPNFTLERVVYPQPLKLSEMDKKGVGEMYPGADPNRVEPPKECKAGEPGCDKTAPPPTEPTSEGFKLVTASKKRGEEEGMMVYGIAVGVDDGSPNYSQVEDVYYAFPPEISPKPVEGDKAKPGYIVSGVVRLPPDATEFGVRAMIKMKDGKEAQVDTTVKVESGGGAMEELIGNLE